MDYDDPIARAMQQDGPIGQRDPTARAEAFTRLRDRVRELEAAVPFGRDVRELQAQVARVTGFADHLAERVAQLERDVRTGVSPFDPLPKPYPAPEPMRWACAACSQRACGRDLDAGVVTHREGERCPLQTYDPVQPPDDAPTPYAASAGDQAGLGQWIELTMREHTDLRSLLEEATQIANGLRDTPGPFVGHAIRQRLTRALEIVQQPRTVRG